MIITHSISSLDTAASGPTYTVPRLARALSLQECTTEIVTLGSSSDEMLDGVRIIRCPPDVTRPRLVARLGRSRAMRETLLTSRADIFHTHGLWMMPNVYPAEAARCAGKPFVLAPRGMLGRDPLKFSMNAKRVFWNIWQKRAALAVSCFHATAESEYDDIRAFGLKQPVAIVPNGIDIPDLAGFDTAERSGAVPVDSSRFILSLGRIHPKKGLDRLIAGFALVAQDHPQWRLRIAGPDEGGHTAELQRQIAAMDLVGRVSIEPPVFGAEKFRLMRQAEVFALSTLHENFGMTVAESLAVETPVISTRGAPWAGLEAHGCGWWIDHGPEAMATALRKSMVMPPGARREMGALGRDWMRQDFGWEGIGAKMAAVYRWLSGGQEKPEWVQV